MRGSAGLAIVTAEVETADVDFDLELGGRITGTVTAVRTGEVLANVKVRVHSPLGDLEAEAVTDDLGFYRTPGTAGGYLLGLDRRASRSEGKGLRGPQVWIRLRSHIGRRHRGRPGSRDANIDITVD